MAKKKAAKKVTIHVSIRNGTDTINHAVQTKEEAVAFIEKYV